MGTKDCAIRREKVGEDSSLMNRWETQGNRLARIFYEENTLKSQILYRSASHYAPSPLATHTELLGQLG